MSSWWKFSDNPAASASPADADQNASSAGGEDSCAADRRRMVEEQLRRRDVTDARVLEVMGHLARERFVPDALRHEAYDDHPLPIGLDQTISQPYIVALVAQLVRPTAECRALEVGVGSGYQAAVLAELCREVYGVEIHQSLAASARGRLAALGYENVVVRQGDGYRGWPEHAPFDIIVVSAAPDHVPQPLIEQLARGGRLAIPVGDRGSQELLLIEKRPDGSLHCVQIAPVQFVPMTGEAEQPTNM